MPIRVIHIVGDAFKDFARSNEGVWLFSEFLEMADQLDSGRADFCCVPGQGLSDAERLLVLMRSPHKASLGLPQPRASREATHKHKGENIMIGRPQEVAPYTYEAELLVDDLCAEMSDHLTGQHVQGMVLMEAARQMLIAVTELHLLPTSQPGSFGFVFKTFNIQFEQFAMPIATRLRCRVLGKSSRNEFLHEMEVSIEIVQLETTVARVHSSYTLWARKLLEATESMKARKILKNSLHALQVPTHASSAV